MENLKKNQFQTKNLLLKLYKKKPFLYHSREETWTFEDPKIVMTNFADWIKTTCKDRPIFISDNNGFDWMFICWYFHHFTGTNPFGFSSQNLGNICIKELKY